MLYTWIRDALRLGLKCGVFFVRALVGGISVYLMRISERVILYLRTTPLEAIGVNDGRQFQWIGALAASFAFKVRSRPSFLTITHNAPCLPHRPLLKHTSTAGSSRYTIFFIVCKWVSVKYTNSCASTNYTRSRMFTTSTFTNPFWAPSSASVEKSSVSIKNHGN